MYMENFFFGQVPTCKEPSFSIPSSGTVVPSTVVRAIVTTRAPGGIEKGPPTFRVLFCDEYRYLEELSVVAK